MTYLICSNMRLSFHVFVACFWVSVCGRVTDVAYLPEPLDDRMVGTVAIFVNRVLSPVVDVNVTQTTHEQLHRDGGEAQEKDRIYSHCQVPTQHLILF